MELDVYFLLGNALIKYKGGVILVSHDERLLKMVCQELWVCSRVRRIIMVSKRKRGGRGGGEEGVGFVGKKAGGGITHQHCPPVVVGCACFFFAVSAIFLERDSHHIFIYSTVSGIMKSFNHTRSCRIILN